MSGSVWYLSFSKKKLELKKYPKKTKKKKNQAKKTKQFLFFILFLSVFLLFVNTASADPINDTFHINLQTTFANGTIDNGTFDLAFNITASSSSSCLAPVVYNYSTTQTTDSRGILSLYLPTIGTNGGNLSALGYDTQYYLCYYRDGTLIDVNQLSRVPYSFRATEVNLSEVIPNSNFSLGNFNLTAGWIFANINASYIQNAPWLTNASSEPLWNGNYSNFSVVYGYAINATASGISWATALNGTLATWAEALNGTLALNSSLANYYLITNPYGYYNSTTIPTGSLNVNSSNFSNYSNYLGGHPASFFMPLNTSVYGNFDFNGGWANGGLSINGGNLFAQTLYVYNISSLQVTNLNVNGSFIPYFDNTFDLGNSTNRWRNIYVSGNSYVNGTVFSTGYNLSNGYLYATNNTYYLASNPSNYINWANAVNGTLMLQSNWNATNTSYYLATNPFGFYNSTNPSPETNWNANYSNFSNIYANVTLYNASWSNTTNLTYNSYNATGLIQNWNSTGYIENWNASGYLINWSNANAQEPNWNANYSNFSNIYANVTLYNASWSSITNTSYLTIANWNATNTSYYLASNPSAFYNATGNGFTTFNISTGNFTINNQTAFNLFVVNGTNGRVGIGTNTSQNALNVIGDINGTGTVFSSNINLTTIAGYALNATSNGISWATATNGTLATWAEVINGSVDLNNTFEYIPGLQENGVANFNGTINLNGSYVPSWANITNGTLATWAEAVNGTLMLQSNWNATNTSYYLASNPFGFYNSTNPPPANETNWNANYSNFSNIYANVTLYNASWSSTTNLTYDIGTKYATNNTYYLASNPSNYINWANAVNGTLMLQSNWNATNTSYYLASNPSAFYNATGNGFTTFNISTGNFTINNQTAFNLFVVNGTNGRVGIGTNTSQNVLNVIGDINATTSVFSQNKNLSIGYDYATNGSYNTNATSPFTANYSNFSSIYGYALNSSLWTLNYSNFSVVYGYALNATQNGITWANALNGTLATWAEAVNGTLMSQATFNTNYTTNDAVYRSFANNYSNFSNIYAYEQNGSLINGLSNSSINTTNGYFNISNQTKSGVFFVNGSTGFIGIGMTNPANELNVNGSINATNSVFAQGKNISIGYQYATNGTFLTTETNWNANYSNFSSVYGYALNSSLWTLNYSNFSVVYGYATNGSGSSNWNANYSNFSNIYANVTLYNSSWSSTTNLTYDIGTKYATNNTYYLASNPSNYINWANAVNGTLMLQSNWNATNTSYLTIANWNATNTSYYLISNPFGFYNSTNPPPANETNWNANYSTYFKINDTNYSILIGSSTGNALRGVTTLGYQAGYQNSGEYLTALGYQSGQQNNATLVTALGDSAGSLNSGNSLTAVGVLAGYNNSGAASTVLGYYSGEQNAGTFLTASGAYSAYQNNGSQVTALGYQSAYQNSGSYVTSLGYYSANLNKGSNVVALGDNAADHNNGSYVTVVGSTSAYYNNGSNVVALGDNAAWKNNGSYVTAVGSSSALGNLGVGLASLGYYSGNGNNGSYVTALGYQAGYNNIGNNTLALGYQAGINNVNSNQFIVQQANVNAVPLIQGNFSSGFVGIGTATPSQALEVNGKIKLGNDAAAATAGVIRWTGSAFEGYNGTAWNSFASNGSGGSSQWVTNGTIIYYTGGDVGIGTATPQNILNVVGDINSTTSVFSQNKNLSIGYDYATNGTFTSGGINWANVLNGTLATWANVVNGTVVQNNSGDIYGPTVFSNKNNLTLGYLYATNGSYIASTNSTYGYALNGSSNWNANYSNFSNIYAYENNGTFYSATNPNGYYNSTSNIGNFTANYSNFSSIYGYALNSSLWTLNYSNFSTVYGYAINGTGGSANWNANYSNFSNIYANVTLYNSSWSSTTNLTYDTGTKYATNNTYYLASNPSNYINWANAVNGTLMLQSNWNATNTSYLTVANWNATNTSYYLTSNPSAFYNATGNNFTTFNISAGNFTINNQTAFNLFVVNGTNGRVGIGTNTSQNALNVIGEINATTSIFSQNKNLSIGYDYATNGSYIASTNSTYAYALNGSSNWNANYSNFSVVYGYALNASLWTLNYTNFSIIYGYATNGTGGTNWNANYSNFSTLYANSFSYYNATGHPTWDVNITNGYFNVSNQTNTSLFFINATNGRIGIGTNTSQNALNVLGDINATTSVFAQGTKNLSIGYDYATNGTFTAGGITWANALNGTLATWAEAVNGTLMSQATFNTNYTTNDAIYRSFANNFSNFSNIYAYEQNGSLINSLSNASINTTNGYFNISNQTKSGVFFVNGSTGFIGIGLTNPANELNVNGSINATNSIFSQSTKNLSIGYDYATNGSYIASNNVTYGYALNGSSNWNANFSNFTTIYGNLLGNISGNFNATNYSVVYGYTLNGTSGSANWNANYSNFTNVYGYATNGTYYLATNPNKYYNSTQQDINFNITNYFNITNQTNSAFFINASTELIGIGTTSPSTPLEIYNKTSGLRVSTAADFENAVYLKNNNATSTLSPNIAFENGQGAKTFIRMNSNNSIVVLNDSGIAGAQIGVNGSNTYFNPTGGAFGIGTTNPQNALSVAGTINSTTSVFAQNTKNLSIGYDYATNGTFLTTETNWNANYSNFSNIYAYENNGTFYAATNPNGYYNSTSNIGNFTANYSNFSSIYGYALNSSLWTLNYSNFSVVYGYALNATQNGITWANALNGTLATWAEAVNGTLMSQATFNTNYTTNDAVYRSFANNYSNFSNIYAYEQNGSLINGLSNSSINTTNGYFNISNQTKSGVFFVNGSTGFIGIGTTTPQNTLNVIGDINATTSVFSQNKNLSIGYDYATNGTFTAGGITWATANNGTLATWAEVINGSVDLNNTFEYIPGLQENGVANFNGTINLNGSYVPSWANITNGTLMLQSNWNATNTSYLTIANWNATNTSYYLTSNPSAFYNATGNGFTTFNISAGNFTINNQTSFNLFVVNGTNGRVGIGTNTSQNALNVIGDINGTGTVFTSNINLTTIAGYALNATSNGISWATATNGTLATWANVVNGTMASWAQVVNGTTAVTNAANTFGNFNQTFNGTTLFLWALKNSVGIGTTTPQNILNVIGDINATTSIFSQNKNLSIGYDYATNNTYLTQTSWNTNYSTNNAAWLNTTNLTYDIGTKYATNGTYLTSANLAGFVNGSGTSGYIPSWNGTNSINNSAIYQNGSNVSIGASSNAQSTLTVAGTVNASSNGGSLIVDSNGNVKIGI